MSGNNLMNGITPSYGGMSLTGVSYPVVVGSNLGSGSTDIYTAPAGKRAWLINAINYNTGSSNTVFIQLKSGGNYYRLQNSVTMATDVTVANFTLMPTLEPGESYAFNCTTTGLNTRFQIIQYDANVPIYSPKLLTLASGDNTLYTVPTGKKAILARGVQSVSGQFNQGRYVNDSGGTRLINCFIVDSGGATGTSNKCLNNNTSVNAAAAATIWGGSVDIDAGDFLVINTNANTATQIAWANVTEF